jgi:alpha-1,3-rhamnosyl/mannosyltransferase
MQRCVATKAIYHEPNYILRPYSGCSIATIHDLSFLHYPQYHPKERVKFMERELPGTLAQAAHIITDAEYVKSELVKYFGIPSESITAIPLGVSADFQPRIERQTQGVLNKYSLDHDGYLLSVATQEPRKNLEGLLQAYLNLPESMQRHFPLVLVGGHGWNCEKIEKRLQSLELKGTVRRLGFVPAHELPCLYSGAAAFAYPSFYEGFGLPPLEAMASATPVLVADNSAMTEVVGDAGIQVDSNDSAAIALGLEQLLSDPVYRKQAGQMGQERAASYTWGKCVDRTLAVYRHAQGL